MDTQVNLRFAYRLTSPKDQFTVALVDSESGRELKRELTQLKTGKWVEASVTFRPTELSDEFTHADELRFDLTDGAELLIDNVLLYVPQ